MYDGRHERKTYGYTQNMEEFYITQYSPLMGRFLDIGAFDGLALSSTRVLAERGWSGVYVEPDPKIVERLHENTRNFATEVHAVAIGETPGNAVFYSCDGMVGSLNTDHVKKWSCNNNLSFTPIIVPVWDVKTLAQKVGTNFDFVNLDVEGINWQIFQQFDWNVWTPKVVCIEYDNHFQEICGVLRKHGYTIVYASPENIVARK